MAMKKISALQSLLKYKFALLIAAGAVTALFVVFVATQTTTINHFLAGANVLKPHTASANLGWDDGCSDAFWAWWMSGDDDDYYDAEAACSGGGGGGGGGDSSGGGGWDDGCSWGWGGCEDSWGGNDGNDGPPYGTCYPGYNMDASGYCYPNGGVDNGCYNSQYNYTYDDCDPAAPYDPTPSLCSDPYYAQMNINECGVVNVPDNNDPFNCDELHDDCSNISDPPTSPNDGSSSCRAANGMAVTCNDGFHCDTVNGGCAPNSTPVTTDGDPDGCDETHDAGCVNPTPPPPPNSGVDEHGCTPGFGYFQRSGVWGCYDTTYSAEHCADVTYALNNKSECGVVDVPAGPPPPIPVDPNNPLNPSDAIQRCERDSGFHWNYLAQRCEAGPVSDPCTTDLHYAAGHPDECSVTVAKCSDPYYAAGHSDCDGVVPVGPPPTPGNGVDEHGCTRGFTWRQDQYTGIWACYDSGSNPPPSSPFDEYGCSIGFKWESRNGVYACYDAGSSGGAERQPTPTRDSSNDCTDEAGNSCDYTAPTNPTGSTGGGRSLWDRVVGPIRGILGH